MSSGWRLDQHLAKHARDAQELRERPRREAAKLFQIVHGNGESGSEFEFNTLNLFVQEGWIRLAKKVRLKNERDRQ